MASRSAPAACTFTPGLRRPITEASLRPSLIGSQKLALNALNREGMIPTRCCGLAVENEGFVENVWIAAEFRLPEVVVHHEHWRSIRAAIIWREGAPEERRNAQEIECVGRDSFTSRPVADGFAVVVLEAYAVIGDGFLKHVVLFTKGAGFVRQEKIASFPSTNICEILNSKYDGTLEILVGKRIDNNTVNNAEHDRRRADAQSQGVSDHLSPYFFERSPDGFFVR